LANASLKRYFVTRRWNTT